MEAKEKQPESLILPLQLVNDILTYLGQRPYTEASPYIDAVRKEAKLYVPIKEEPKRSESTTAEPEDENK